MARLIEVPDAQKCASDLLLQTGDMLLFHASGGRIGSGGDVVEMLGPLLEAIVGEDGNVLTPMGAPNGVLVRARRPGRAAIDVITGDPWQRPLTTKLAITVNP
jgi:hypothetical protein